MRAPVVIAAILVASCSASPPPPSHPENDPVTTPAPSTLGIDDGTLKSAITNGWSIAIVRVARSEEVAGGTKSRHWSIDLEVLANVTGSEARFTGTPRGDATDLAVGKAYAVVIEHLPKSNFPAPFVASLVVHASAPVDDPNEAAKAYRARVSQIAN